MSNDIDNQLRERLKRETDTDRPVFSDRLHVRIVQAIRHAEHTGVPPTASVWPARAWRLAAAVGLALAVSAAAYLSRDDGPQVVERPVAAEERLQVVHEWQAGPGIDRIEAELRDRRLAYLDRDASRFAAFVVATLPTPPTADVTP